MRTSILPCFACLALAGLSLACNGNLVQGHTEEAQAPRTLIAEQRARFAIVGAVSVISAPGLIVPSSIPDELREWVQRYMDQVGLRVVGEPGQPHELDVSLTLAVNGAAVLMRGNAAMDIRVGPRPVEKLATEERIDPANGFGRSLARDLVEALVHSARVADAADTAVAKDAGPAVAGGPPGTAGARSPTETPTPAPGPVGAGPPATGPTGAGLVSALAPPPATTGTAGAPDIAAAKAHTRQGAAFYDLGRYADANAEFERAYLIEQDPALLYNMGQCHRKLGKGDEAVHFFRTYLRRSPNGPFAGAAEKRIKEIEAESAPKPKK
jgi:hypothetical protein